MKRKFLCLALALIMIFSLLPMNVFAEEISGTCGDNAIWTLKDGVLTISGTGDMNDYDNYNHHYPPWHDLDDIETVIIKKGITSIGDDAFKCCYSLKSVTISNSVTSIGDNAFLFCSSLTDVVIPDSVLDIGYNSFGDSGLINVIIGNGVTSIGEWAFKNCKNLTSVIIGNSVKSIGNYAFYECNDLESITIPNSVTSIGDDAFYSCGNLTTAILGNNVTSIGDDAFMMCGILSTISIPKSVTIIGNGAFNFCYLLMDIYYGGTKVQWDKLLKSVGEKNSFLKNATVHYEGDPAPIIAKQPTNLAAKSGTTGKFIVSATGNDLTYQWQYKRQNGWWTNCTATSAKTPALSVNVREAINGYMYRCVVKNSEGNSVNSDTATLTVTPNISKQPNALTAKSGATGKFSVTATGDGLTYQWQYQKEGATTWTNSTASSGKTATFSVNARSELNGCKYRCKVTNSCGNSVYSKAVILTVTPGISKQPTNLTAKSGTTGKFSVTADGVGLTYQWQYLKPGSTTWANSTSASGKTATFSVSVREAINGYKYRCVVKDSNGKSLTSSTATLTVTPNITKQPTNLTAANGTIGKFTITAKGDGLTYQWQYLKPGSTTWTNSTAASGKTATFSVNARTAINGYKYRCVVKNSCGNSITSSVVTLTVK